MNYSNYHRTAELRGMAAPKYKTEIIWILSGSAIILLGAFYYLRMQNFELKSISLVQQAKILSQQKNIDTLEIVLQKSQKENKYLSEKLASAQQTS
jgi:hypothetical protein